MGVKNIFLFLFFMLLGFLAKADHIMASELTYEYKGNNKYDITLSIYRDCAGIDVMSVANIFVISQENDTDIVHIEQIPGTGKELNIYCPSIKSTCNDLSSPYPGVQLYTYKGSVFLNPKNSDSYRLVWNDCCRNNLINTASIFDIGEEAYINLKYGAGNSSPQFLTKAVPAVCLGESYCYGQGASESNSDSLVFEQIDPVGITYYAGYSKTAPLTSSTPIQFNSQTGDLCFTPSNIEVTVFAFLVKEYRKGILIGSVTRDMQVVVVPCNNKTPYVKGIDGTASFVKTACAGENICFNIPSVDADAGQTLKVEWNNGISGATFNPGTGSRPIGKFCWSTTAAMARNAPYVFTVTVSDDNCPRIGYQTFTYTINLAKGVNFDLGSDANKCAGETYQIQANISSPNYKSKIWSDLSSGNSITVNQSGTYYLTVVDSSGCSITDSVHIKFHPLPILDIVGDTIACNGESISLKASGAKAYQWGPQPLTSATSDAVTVLIGSNQTITVQGTDINGCKGTAQRNLLILPRQTHTLLADTTICKGNIANITVTNPSGILSWNTTQYIDNPNNFNTFCTPLKSMQYIATVKTNNFCNWKDTINITVNEDLEAAFKIKNDYLDINQNEAFFTDQSKGKIAKWIWDFGDGSTDFQTNPSHNYNDLGTYIVKLQIYDQAGCTDTISKRIKVDYFTIYAANAFTPNNDGKNDVFYAYGNNITKFNMKIFNRWGEQIFESNSLQDGWDGGNSQIDTYVYLITYTLENKANSERTIRGIVNLLR